MSNSINNNQTLEEFRLAYNDLVDEVGGIGTLRTSQKGSLVDAVNSIVDQFFFFQDFEYTGSNGTSSNRTFSGDDNFGNSLNYSVNRLLVFKNGVLLRSGTDYAATNGTSITLTSSAANSDIIRVSSFTGSYEGTSGATQALQTQWLRTGGGAIYNHNTSGGVVINSDDTGVVTTPASGYGIQLESTGSNIFLNTGGTSNEVFINGNLDLTSGAQIQINGSQITSSALSGFTADVRSKLSASGDISYNSSTGVISFTAASAPVTSVAGRTGAITLAEGDVSFTGGSLQERVQDIVGSFISATGSSTVTYNDGAGTLVINSTGKTQEEIEDIVGAMFSGNTETGVGVTYEDSDGTLDVVIGNDAIVSSMIADNTIVGGNIAANTIGSSEIAANAVGSSELADNAVDTDAIANNAVTLGTKTSGNYVGTLVAGTALSSTGATSGEGIAHTISLDNTSVTAGSYGSASSIPTFTVDAQGRLTAASAVTVDTYSGWSLGGDTGGAGSVPEGTTINIVGGEGIDTAFSGSTLTVIGELATTSNKGVASFTSTDFGVSSGVVSISQERIEDIIGSMVTGGGATSVTYNDSAGELVISSNDTNTDTTNFNINANGGANENISAGETIRFNGGGATTVSRSGNAITITSTDTNTDTNTVTSVGVSGQQNTGTITLAASGASSISQSGNTITISSTDTNTQLSDSQVRSKLSGSTGISYNSSSGAISLSNTISNNMNQNVRTSDTVQFAEVRSTGNVIAYYSSDLALKENINPIDNALNKVMSLGGYNFDWKDSHIKERGGEDGFFVKKSDVGIIAQEVQKVLPEAVGQRDDGTLGVRYEQIVPLLIESIKELKSEIESLKS